MKHHYEMIIAVAFCALSLSAQTNVVYEPLEVASGYNRDVIAEVYPFNSTNAVSALYALGSSYGITSCFATESVIDTVNKVYQKAHPGYFKADDLLTAPSSGWPDDYHTTIRCIEDAKDNYSDPDVIFQLAPYDGPNALCLRPNIDDDEVASGGYGNQRKGTLRFKKVGCYNKLFFLVVSLRKGSVSLRRVITTIYYTDKTSTSREFTFEDGLGGKVGQKVHKTNIYEGMFKKNTSKDSGTAYASVFDVEVPESKLIDSIVFENPIKNSSVTILAVTGRTADVEMPEEESMAVSEIDKTSFQACWDAIEDATAEYRLDVAEDIDFQRILEDYNNLDVDDATCQEVVGLVSNTDYYWRVRSVNSDGGQSASSAPRRVKTAPDPEKGDTPPTIGETDDDITTELAEYANAKATLATYRINRTLYRDGYFNTICLPFSLDEAGIAASPLTGCKLFAFESATKAAVGLDLVITPVTTIEAGVPYLIKWEDMGDIIPKPLEFHNVNIVTSTGLEIGEGDVHFVGHIAQAHIPCEIQDNLFVGENNTLYWPDETNSKMKGFRAYFAIQTSSPSGAPIKRGTPARLVERKNTPTDIITVNGDRLAVSGKMLINGQLVIIRDGKYYNVLGGRIQ